jgi:glucose/mannose-6-phosphate isomerase
MEQAILDFAKQFSFEPEILNRDMLPAFNVLGGWKVVVGGMGGSHLAADIFSSVYSSVPISTHRMYGLPPGTRSGGDLTFYIASSYSGNTEETISFLKAAIDGRKNCAAIALGGTLAQMAQERKIPLILLPDTGIQPRSAIGFSMLALARLIGNDATVKEIQALEGVLKPDQWQKEGEALADQIKGKIPVIYASEANASIAYNWKIKFNETGKVPAFCNIFPELNHNELAGMDVLPSTKELSDRLHFIFLEDAEDHPRIIVRTSVTEQLYSERGLSFSRLQLGGKGRLERIFNSLLLADWAALKTAQNYRAEPDQVAIIESFKKLIG